jgi:hypothetical protein
MRTAIKIVTFAGCLSLLAPAQEKEKKKREPEFAKVPEPPSAEARAAREAGIGIAWKNALGCAHQIAASQGYRRRDTRWAAALPDEGFTIIPLQLYAGNDYYVAIGTDTDSNAIAATAFDPERMLIKTAPDRGSGKLVLHITPERSGPHYLRLHLKEKPARATHCALTYIYK